MVSGELPRPQRLLLLMDHSLDFVEFLGGGGVIEGVSAAVKALGGYDPEHLIGRHYQDIVHPDDCARAAAAFASLLRGDDAKPITLRYRHKDGSWRTVQASARNFLDDPAVRAIIILTRDMTDQINAEASLAHANVELRRLSQQLILGQEKERSRIARELHDDVQQILVGLRMNMEPSMRAEAAHPSIDLICSWVDLVKEAIDHLHELTVTLRPPAIGDRGLVTELRAHVNRLALRENQNIALEADDTLGHLAPDLELACFRIAQEALVNAIQHSGAKNLRVCLRKNGSELLVSIHDDGVGFDVAAARARATQAGSIGLLSMRERAALAGGRLEVNSSIGQGTYVRALFRVEREDPTHDGRQNQ
jgi:PAS domain S-box-containing protein